jgi:hypothetical protein
MNKPLDKAGTWRDRIKVHAAADLFPMMSDVELRDLGEDIRRNGLKQPIAFYTEARRGRGGTADITVGAKANGAQEALELPLINGRNRLASMELAGILDAEELKNTVKRGKIIWRISPEAYVVTANVHRRHLTTEQKLDLIAALLRAKPERSDRATAKIAQVSDKTVAVIRDEPSIRANAKDRWLPNQGSDPVAPKVRFTAQFGWHEYGAGSVDPHLSAKCHFHTRFGLEGLRPFSADSGRSLARPWLTR